MEDRVRFADLFNYFIYDGVQVIEAEQLHEMDTTAIALPYGQKGTQEPVQRYRDLLKVLSAKCDDRAAYLLLGIENQSDVHYAMPVRNMLYDALQYAKQVKDAARSNRNQGAQELGKKAGRETYLSGFCKEDRLLPVVTLVVYWSPDQWNGPLSIHEMFALEDEKLLDLVPDYKIHLMAPQQMEDADFEKFQTSIGAAFQYIKYSKDPDALEQKVETNRRFRALDRQTVEVINVVTGSQIEIDEEKEEVDVCEAIEGIKKKVRDEEAQKVRQAEIQVRQAETKVQQAETKAQQARETVTKSIKNLMETMHWTAEQAMDAMQIPDEERAIYME
jgi:hypothetical protein